MRSSLLSTRNIIIFAALIAAIALRLTHIDADTPSGLSWSAGLYVDEGYKTLSPRNLTLFGNTHWHDADTYHGWMKASPVTQWSVYTAFKYFGVSISSARIVPIVYFSLFVLAYVFFLKNRFTTKLFYLGLILILTDITLFTFSRIALFEIPMSFFVYSLIIPITLYYEKKEASNIPIILLLLGSLVAAYTIKLSGLIYFVPALIAAILFSIINTKIINKRQIVISSSFIFIAITLVLGATYKLWSSRLGFSPDLFIYSIAKNPLSLTSPAILIAATICAAHIVAYQTQLYVNNLYRFTLLFIAVTSLIILSLFEYAPLRYYVPFLPAYILLIIEWFHTTSFDKKNNAPVLLTASVSILLFFLAFTFSLVSLGLHEKVQMRYLLLACLLLSACFWYFNNKANTSNNIKKILSGLITIALLHNIYFISQFIYKPSYNANEIRHKLTKIVKNNETIAGGWAPFLTLGTPIKALYANTVFNPPETLIITRPDYFMLSETKTALETYNIIKKNKNIITGKEIPLGRYNKTKVRMYPLFYID